jgi:hypothetical protein
MCDGGVIRLCPLHDAGFSPWFQYLRRTSPSGLSCPISGTPRAWPSSSISRSLELIISSRVRAVRWRCGCDQVECVLEVAGQPSPRRGSSSTRSITARGCHGCALRTKPDAGGPLTAASLRHTERPDLASSMGRPRCASEAASCRYSLRSNRFLSAVATPGQPPDVIAKYQNLWPLEVLCAVRRNPGPAKALL